MRLHKTGHAIADTVSDLIGELPDGDYKAAYGILRHNLFQNGRRFFELDKGFWGARHYDGLYRISFGGTQAKYVHNGPKKPHGLTLQPWRNQSGSVLICPPTSHVCEFFRINLGEWLIDAIRRAGNSYTVRTKGDSQPVDWDSISKVITFNSTIAIEALTRGIPVISDPVHSTVGSYTSFINSVDNYSREELLCFCAGHMFTLSDKESIECLINHYLMFTSDGTQEKR